MRLHTIFLFLFLIGLQRAGFAQETFTLKGKIVDKKSEEPLSWATVLYDNNSLGFTADEKGEFNFQLTAEITDSIEFNYMGYKPLKRAISDLLERENPIIKLQTDQIVLKEVVVTGHRINVKKLMRKVYRHYRNHKPGKPHLAEAYFRETGSYGGNYVFFNESRGFSIFLGNPNKFNAALFSNYKFFPVESRISDVAEVFKKQLKKIDKERGDENRRFVGFSYNLNNYRRFQEYGPVSRKNHRKFKYSLDSTYGVNGIKFLKIGFARKGFEGYLLINGINLDIQEAEYRTNLLVSNPYKTPVEGKVRFVLSYIKKTPYLSEIFSKSTFRGLTMTNYLKVVSQKFGGFKVTDDEYWGFSNAVVNPYITYKPTAWPTISFYKKGEFEKIRNDLKVGGMSLEQQFIKNSGHQLNSSGADSSIEAAKEKIEELKNYFE